MSSNFSIPSNAHPVLNPDGTMHRIWYNYLQGLSGVASGPQVSGISAETRPPDSSQTVDTGSLAEPSQDAKTPAPDGASSTGTDENHTEPAQTRSQIIAIVESLLYDYGITGTSGPP